jgi:hypothetical protein
LIDKKSSERIKRTLERRKPLADEKDWDDLFRHVVVLEIPASAAGCNGIGDVLSVGEDVRVCKANDRIRYSWKQGTWIKVPGVDHEVFFMPDSQVEEVI